MAQPPEKCIFCGSTDELTSEHIISRRYHKFIPRTMKSYKTLRSVEYPDRSSLRIGKRNADPRDWKVKCVCEKNCNNGWMRELDDESESVLTPLFTGKPLRLTQEQQTTVATWTVMKAIVAEYEDPSDVSTHHTQRKVLFTRKLPPAQGWSVWIGYYPRRIWTPTYAIAPFLFLPPNTLAKRSSPLATHYNGSITTQVIGELFIQVSHAPKPFGIGKWRFPPLPDGGVLRRIWPADRG